MQFVIFFFNLIPAYTFDMGRVLVDKHEAIAGLRDDIGVVQLRACGAQSRHDVRVPGDGAVQAVEDEPVLGPARNQRTAEEQHAGEGRKQRAGAEQREAVQHVVGFLVAHQRRAPQGAGQQLHRQHQRPAQRPLRVWLG